MALKLSEWDASEHIEDNEQARILLEEVAKDGDASEIAEAIRTVARARGMTELAKQAGIPRSQLYEAVNRYPKKDVSALLKILDALGANTVEGTRRPDAAE